MQIDQESQVDAQIGSLINFHGEMEIFFKRAA
jgi:hypothetical protein